MRETLDGVREALIGYRVYNAEGNREDLKGRFIGWGSSYDAWIPVASPRIQRIDTVSHFYKLTGNKSMVYDNIFVVDTQDVLANSKTTKQWCVPRSNHFWDMNLASDSFNEFGALGGFEILLNRIRTGASLGIPYLCSIMLILLRSMPSWHRQFAVKFIPQLREAVEATLTNPEALKKFNYESYKSLIQNFGNILKRHYPSSASCIFTKSMDDNYHKIIAHLSFLAAANMIVTEKLDTRISGIKEITALLESKSGLSDKEKLDLLLKKNVVESVFEAKRSHVQLLQRGKVILWFLIDQGAFSEKEIRVLWSATKKGEEQSKLEFYKILEHLQIKLSPAQISIIISLFTNEVEPQDFMWQEIDCVSKLTQYVGRQSDTVRDACDLLW